MSSQKKQHAAPVFVSHTTGATGWPVFTGRRSTVYSVFVCGQGLAGHPLRDGRQRQRFHGGRCLPGRVRHRLYALAVAFQLSEGGNAWGIYRLSRDEDLWVFFAASGGSFP
jgi:hypothetical protein